MTFSHQKNRAVLCSLVGLWFSSIAGAQLITVNTVEDVVDFASPQTAAQLPGPDGRVSFREAVAAANNTPGPQTIEFAIPASDFWLFPGVALLRVENSPGGFALTDNGTTVDFTSQTRNIGDTNPTGNEIGIFSLMSNFTLPQAGITVAADNCTIRGLDTVRNFGYGLLILGSNNRVLGCHIFEPVGGGPVYASVAIRPLGALPPTGNIIGGTGAGEGNTLACSTGSAIEITGPTAENVVIGNALTRSHVAGVLIQSGATGTRIGGASSAERNVIAGNGTGSGEIPQYCDILMNGVSGTRVEGNYLGTGADGMTAAAPPAVGIEMHGCSSTVIVNNVISGYLFEVLHHGITPVRTGTAIYITTGAGGVVSNPTVIQGNRIGVGADGLTPLPNAEGIRLAPGFATAMDVRIGGAVAGEGNTIANSAGAGIVVSNDATGIRVSGNSIFANGAPDALFPARSPAIDLLGAAGTGGVTPNDPGDADTGGNGLQNFPVLASAQRTASGVRIAGSLGSLPSRMFSLEFFSSPECDPSGFGQGRRFLGSTSVTTNGAGDASFEVSLPASVAVGEAVTSTATLAAEGSTSEFSACVGVTAQACPADFDGSGTLSVQDVFDFLSVFFSGTAAGDFNQSGAVSVQDVFDFLSAYFAGCP